MKLLPLLSLLLLSSFTLLAAADADRSGFGDESDEFDGIGPGEDFGQYSDEYGGGDDEGGLPLGGDDDEKKFGAGQHIFGVLELDDLVFDKVVGASHDILVLFYADFSVESKALMDVLRGAAKLIEEYPSCLLAKINGDANPRTYKKLKVKEYPTFLKFAKGSKEPEEYKGEHSDVALVSFLTNEEKVGRVEELEGFTEAFMLHPTERERMLELTREQVASSQDEVASHGAYYAKVMENVLKNGEGFIQKEIGRLQRLMNAPGVKFQKEQEFRARVNVLKVFARADGKDEL